MTRYALTVIVDDDASVGQLFDGGDGSPFRVALGDPSRWIGVRAERLPPGGHFRLIVVETDDGVDHAREGGDEHEHAHGS